ncbi:MAG: CPBP family intramembrane metalloprotease [Lewinellaceae bacterium]|nr:CPBP family intramembrane metalloprotease [Lewinellaceae bacterium]
MKRYFAPILTVLGFFFLLVVIEPMMETVFLAPLFTVPELGDNYGLLPISVAEHFLVSNVIQLLFALGLIYLFRMGKSDYPLQPFFAGPARENSRQFLWGTAGGTVLIASAAAVPFLSGMAGFEATPFSMRELSVMLALMMFIALGEEVIFRGYILQELSEQMDRNLALGISALIFALAHIASPNYGWIPLLNLFLAGLLLGLAYLRFNSIWAAVGLHFSWNFVQGPILGFEVSGKGFSMWLEPEFSSGPGYISGNIFGLEGTVAAAAVQLAAVVWLYMSLSRAGSNQEAQNLQPEPMGPTILK